MRPAGRPHTPPKKGVGRPLAAVRICERTNPGGSPDPLVTNTNRRDCTGSAGPRCIERGIARRGGGGNGASDSGAQSRPLQRPTNGQLSECAERGVTDCPSPVTIIPEPSGMSPFAFQRAVGLVDCSTARQNRRTASDAFVGPCTAQRFQPCRDLSPLSSQGRSTDEELARSPYSPRQDSRRTENPTSFHVRLFPMSGRRLRPCQSSEDAKNSVSSPMKTVRRPVSAATRPGAGAGVSVGG